jgi:murein DD-endopeptidase MepM/ murein hydrolase activator NlpD
MSREAMAVWKQLSRTVVLAGVSVMSLLLNVGEGVPAMAGRFAIAQASSELCPRPALSRVQSHQVKAGETIDGIAAAYNLLPITLLAMNSDLPTGALAPGTTLTIPPFNGVEVQVSSGQTWQDIATAYQVRADVLFEVNGCPETIPNRIFVPGVSWLLESATTNSTDTGDPLAHYPLAEPGRIIRYYGWQPDPNQDELVFNSGITLETTPDTTVLAAGAGTVAYVGEDPTLGTLIVINHNQGFQTRYASIVTPTVSLGESVSVGQPIAVSAPPSAEDGTTAEVYFEVRTNSALGWVARNPGDYLPELAVR